MGARNMVIYLREKYDCKVSEYVLYYFLIFPADRGICTARRAILLHLKDTEPDAVASRTNKPPRRPRKSDSPNHSESDSKSGTPSAEELGPYIYRPADAYGYATSLNSRHLRPDIIMTARVCRVGVPTRNTSMPVIHGSRTTSVSHIIIST
jgi:hypothetical protein